MNTSFEKSANTTDEWYTPKEIIDALGKFDLDPCAPVKPLWQTATQMYNKNHDGLTKDWVGLFGKSYEEAHPEEFEEPEEVPMKPNQILLVSVYQVMALNEMCNCCVLDIEPSIKNKDKETKKLFYAAKKRVNWYQKEVNNLTISSGTVYVDFNDSLDLYTKPLLLKYQQALENYLSTIKGVENPYFASLVEVARSMTKLSITEISNRIKECIKFAEDSAALRHYKQQELLDIINNLVKWVFRKAEDINYNDSSECVEAYKNLVDAYQNPNIIGECIIKAQQLNDKEDESKI